MTVERVGPSSKRVAAVVLVAALAVVGVPTTPLAVGPSAAAPAFEVRGSVGQVAVIGATPGTTLVLEHDGDELAVGTADAQGAHLFREVPPGTGLTVSDGLDTSDPVTVTDETSTTTPTGEALTDLYARQDISASALGLQLSPFAVTHRGSFGYVETRDGTTLAVLSSLPVGSSEQDGPFPVVVEYSGYAPSNPSTAGTPSPTQLAANLAGYAWVGVNMRGTTCSGGAFDYFETLQSLDGHDVIEAVAAQGWADPDGIGMIGISYPGISQLFVGATRPPHLSAIAPLSVIADTYRSTLYPGGILNDGFAQEWASDRDQDALPNQSYAPARIAGGDTTCAANQALRLQRVEIVPQLDPGAHYELARGDRLRPASFVDQIDVPVFLAGTFQDEQTGPHWPTMIDDLTAADPLKVFLTNGSHIDPLGPAVAPHLLDFFDLYLKREAPSSAELLLSVGPTLWGEIYGVPGLQPLVRDWTGSSYAQARAQYEAEPAITVLWENGACAPAFAPAPGGCGGAQWPYPSSTSTHASWPAPGTQPWVLRLLPDGRLGAPGAAGLGPEQPRSTTAYRYEPLPTAQQRTFSGSSSAIWRTDAAYQWTPAPEGTSATFLSAPMTSERRLLGSASVDLWIRSSAPDVDLEVNLSEVTPDGDEVYIQSGWLRASHRALDPSSTPLLPVHSHLEADAQPLPADQHSLARVEVHPFAHVLRPGSRLRLTVEAPGGNRPFWTFAALGAPGGTEVELSLSDVRPSQVVLPFVGGDAPDERPACGWLRSQPCRDLEPLRAPTDVELVATGQVSAVVSWRAPAGGTPTGYEVTLQPGGVSQTVGAGSTSATFAGLAPGDHHATVVATFADGEGPPSSPSLLELVPRCNPFSDVDRAHPFCRDIWWMDQAGISTGFADGTYRPSAAVSRQAMSAFLYRLAGEPPFPTPSVATFRDVSTTHPFFTEVEWMAHAGISTGYQPGPTFRPSVAVSRQAMSAFLHRMAGEPAFDAPTTGSFTDVSTAHPFFTEVEWMADTGISTGYQPGPTFRPSVAVSRQAMSAFLRRLVDGPGVDV